MSVPQIKAGDVTREEAIDDIIESVAMEQAALSHILNAEGEKIQHFLNMEADEAALLEVNKSVNSLVSAVTSLEVILEEKLRLFSAYLSKIVP